MYELINVDSGRMGRWLLPYLLGKIKEKNKREKLKLFQEYQKRLIIVKLLIHVTLLASSKIT